MKYARASLLYEGIFDYYCVNRYFVEKLARIVSVTLMFVHNNESGFADISFKEERIEDEKVLIIDPGWDERSTPPKPEGFNLMNPTTWGGLTYDDIPKIYDPGRLHATRLINALEKPGAIPDEVIIDTLVALGKLPSQEAGWIKVVE